MQTQRKGRETWASKMAKMTLPSVSERERERERELVECVDVCWSQDVEQEVVFEGSDSLIGS